MLPLQTAALLFWHGEFCKSTRHQGLDEYSEGGGIYFLLIYCNVSCNESAYLAAKRMKCTMIYFWH